MIVVVNINPEASSRTGTRAIVRVLTRLCAGPVVERHYLRVSAPQLLEPQAVVFGPQGVPFDAYPETHRAHLFGLIRSATAAAPRLAGGQGPAVLGICGGHQALALAHGGAIAPVHGGVATGSYEGHRKETGRRVVRPEGGDPLITAEGEFVVSHVEGVRVVPEGWVLVGEGTPCRVQALRAGDRRAWGVQFHPERGADGLPLLRRFLALAGLQVTG